MPERTVRVIERTPEGKVAALGLSFRDGERVLRLGDALVDRSDRWRSIEITGIERWPTYDRGEITGHVWYVQVFRNTSRRGQAIAAERCASAYEPRRGWNSAARGDQDEAKNKENT